MAGYGHPETGALYWKYITYQVLHNLEHAKYKLYIKIKHANYFVVPGKGGYFLGLLEIQPLDLLSKNCTIIDAAQKANR